MFFVDDDQREISNRRKDRGASAHNHARVTTLDAMPLLRALPVGECRVQDGYFVAKDLMQIGGDRWGEADFRDEKDGGASGLKHSAHAREIDSGLPRAGDAMQEHSRKLPDIDRMAQTGESVFLSRVEIEFERSSRLAP